MAEEPSFRESGTPSPKRKTDTFSFRSLRVKPAMTTKAYGFVFFNSPIPINTRPTQIPPRRRS